MKIAKQFSTKLTQTLNKMIAVKYGHAVFAGRLAAEKPHAQLFMQEPGKFEEDIHLDAKATWHQRLSFTGSAGSGFQVPLGVIKEQGGDDDGLSPMELLLIGLAGCTAMDAISIMQKKRQDVTAFEVRAHAERAEEHPKVFTHVTLEYLFTGHNLDRAAAERSVELSATRYCSAQAMLRAAVPIESKITLIEA